MTNGLVGVLRRSGAITAAGWRRRRLMRSAIVPSSAPPPALVLQGRVGSSLSLTSGCESLCKSASSSSTCCGAGRLVAAFGVSLACVCADVARPGKTVFTNRACGDT
eukprot:6198685-Pleurochrysis_carterae.AAC.5